MDGYPTNHLGVRDLLFLNEGNGPNGRARFREVGRQAGIDRGAVRPLARRRLHRPERRRAARPLRRERRGPEPLLRERAARRAGWASASSTARAAPGVADPNAGMGIAAGDFSGDGRPDLVVTQLARAGARGLPQPRRVVRERAARVRHGVRDELHRLGRVVGRPEQRRQPRPRARERRDPGHEPGEGRRAGPGAREPRAASSRTRRRSSGSAGSRRTNGRGLAAADFDNDGRRGRRDQLDRRQARPAPRHGRLGPLARGEAAALRAGRGRHRGPARTAAGSSQEVHAGLELPLLRGPARPLRARRRDEGDRR